MTDDVIDHRSDDAARAALASLIDLHGPALLHEPDRLRRQLDGALPDARRDVELILLSMHEEVPHALLAAHSDEQLRTLFPQLVDRLARNTGVEPVAATWAVRTWAHALAVAVDGGDAARPEGLRRAVDRRPPGADAGDPPTARRVLDDREANRRSSTAEVLGFGTRPIRHKAPSTVRPPGPIVSPPTAPAAETLVAFDASRERAVSLDATQDPHAVETESPAPAVTPATIDASREADVAAPAIETTSESHAAEPPVPDIVDAGPPTPSAERPLPVDRSPLPDQATEAAGLAAVAAERVDEPAEVAATVPHPPAPVAPPVGRPDSARRTPPPVLPVEPATLAFVTPRRSSSRTFALAAAIAAAIIVVGATLWPAPRGREPDPKSGGTTTARSTVATTPPASAPAPAVPPPPVAAREPAVVASQPAGRSEPAPADSQRATQAVPQPSSTVVAPAPTTPPPVVAISAEPAVESPLPRPTPAPPVAAPPARPKPAPRVVRPEPAASRQVAVASAAAKPAKPADARKPTTPAACTRSTCGSVVSVRAIDDAATRDYEVIVRLDDRTIRAVRMPARWSPGARVRVVGNRFEPAGG